jgi:hypothetical protein
MTDHASPAARAPHVLYVAWGFPPSRGSGVYRALATANAFAGLGWDVTVITTDREMWDRYTGSDPELELQVDPRIEVVRVPFSWPGMETDLRRWSRTRVYAPGAWRRLRQRLDVRDFPERNYGTWRKPIERAALAVHAAKPVDLAVATANPNVAFTAPWRLHHDRGIPFVMDYRDAWSLNTFTGGRLTEPDSEAARLERALLADCLEAWFVNDPIAEWHRAEYPESAARMQVVMNGWDPELDPGQPSRAAAPDRPLRFGYVGTVTPVVPMKEFLDGWRIAHDDPSLSGAEALLHGFLGFYRTPRADLAALVKTGADVGVRYLGPVSRTALRTTYDGFDVLLLLQGPGRYITGGKLFDYLSTGLPIVSVQDASGHAHALLEGYPLWFPAASMEPDAVAEALRAAARAARTDDPAVRAAAYEFAQDFRRDRQLEPRITSLRDVVDRTGYDASTEAPEVSA